MKKHLIATALFLVTAFSAAFANDNDDINRATYASFNKDFQTAKLMSWQKQQDYSVATFSLNGQVMMAYYNKENALVAVLHHIAADHLPILLFSELKKDYSQYWVTDLFEAASNGESHYYLTLENADYTVKLKSVNFSDWAVSKKICKDSL